MQAKSTDAPSPDPEAPLRYPAQQDSVVQALEKLRQVPWQNDAGPDLMSSLQIVLAEALNNIIEHSCSDLTNTWFRLDCDFDGDAVSVVIEDNGRPMPGAALPEGLAPSLSVPTEDLPEGGFGWFLIRSICSNVCYTRDGSINRLELELTPT
jgi:serine/threonine-protein kinase RsbW